MTKTKFAVNGLPIPKGWEATKWTEPPTGDMKLRVMYRSGYIPLQPFKASELDWSDKGVGYDVVAVGKWVKGDKVVQTFVLEWMTKKHGRDFRLTGCEGLG